MAVKETTAKYVVTNAVLHDQPAAGKANPEPNDGILKLSGTITKNGKPQTTPHFIVKERQMRQYVATRKVNGTTITFTLTEAHSGRGQSKPTEPTRIAAIESRYK